jgi:hypothetical protein
MATDDELRQIARKRAEEKAGFYTHLAIYIVVNIFLIEAWWVTAGPGTFPWFVFILFGWGIGIVWSLCRCLPGEALHGADDRKGVPAADEGAGGVVKGTALILRSVSFARTPGSPRVCSYAGTSRWGKEDGKKLSRRIKNLIRGSQT